MKKFFCLIFALFALSKSFSQQTDINSLLQGNTRYILSWGFSIPFDYSRMIWFNPLFDNESEFADNDFYGMGVTTEANFSLLFFGQSYFSCLIDIGYLNLNGHHAFDFMYLMGLGWNFSPNPKLFVIPSVQVGVQGVSFDGEKELYAKKNYGVGFHQTNFVLGLELNIIRMISDKIGLYFKGMCTGAFGQARANYVDEEYEQKYIEGHLFAVQFCPRFGLTWFIN